MAPQLQELWDDTDDWTGVSSAAERRKRQNRLSQRAARKRKHAHRVADLNVYNKSQPQVAPINTAEIVVSIGASCGVVDGLIGLHGFNIEGVLGFHLIRCPEMRDRALQLVQRALTDYSLRTLRLTDLHSLSRLNLLSAFADNAVYLGICFEDMYHEECISPFNLCGPSSSGVPPTALAPPTLQATDVQKAVVHHPWIDLIPIAGIRDNILRGIDTGLIQEEDLCRDLATPENKDGLVAPIAVWGPSWNWENWEIGENFLKKWSCLVQGCPEVIEATNIWRDKRGEAKIDFVIN